MAQVPYKEYPTVSPDSAPIPKVDVNAPGAAFGMNIAQSTQAFGAQVGHSGDELFREGMRIKALENDAWAKDADVNAMIEIGKATSDFKQLEGLQATAGLNAYNEKIKSIRAGALASAPSPDARKMLDSQIARRVGFAIVDAGAHAGNQAKMAADRASTARQGAATDDADPSNPEKFQNDLKIIEAEVRSRGAQKGDFRETTDHNVDVAKSKAILNGTNRMAPNEPERARNFFEQNKDLMQPNDREAALKTVNTQMALKQSRTDAQSILKDFDPSKGPGQDQKYLDKAKALGEEKGADNPYYVDYLEQHVRQGLNMGHQAYRDTQNGNRMAVEQFAIGKDGNKITDINGIIGPGAPDEIRDKFNSLSPENQRYIKNFITQRNTPIPNTLERETRFNKLMGLSHTDPAGFSDLSIIKEDLTVSQVGQLQRRQQAISGKTTDDTKINQYLSWARPVLNTVGIGPSATDEVKAGQYNHFIGALQTRIQQFQDDNKKPPGSEEVKKMTLDLVKEVTGTERRFFGVLPPGGGRRFEMEVPEGDAQRIRARARERTGKELSDEMVQDIYQRALK